MRASILLAVVVAVCTVAFAFELPVEKGNVHLFVMALIGLPGVACYIYGARLADQEQAREPDKFKPFTGTSNVPIFGALWRAAQAGDRAAKWAFTGVIVLPLVGMALIFFEHKIAAWLAG